MIPSQLLAGEYPGAYRNATARLRIQSYLDVGISYFFDLTHPNDGLTPYDGVLDEVADLTQKHVTYQRLL